MSLTGKPGTCHAMTISIGGFVQGVGFRPFVYRLAQSLGVRGWVANDAGQVSIHAEADVDSMKVFIDGLVSHAPTNAQPVITTSEVTGVQGHTGFTIKASRTEAYGEVHILPDLPVCDDCLAELFDPANRRYRYPFTHCSHCGPRHTVVESLPYDRHNTSMHAFAMCSACEQEYTKPGDRRFHAELVACEQCGPQLEFENANDSMKGNRTALATCAVAIKRGDIVAIKGTGGYHLVCDARSAPAVARLRARKRRPDKPLAILMDIAQLDKYVQLNTQEHELLTSRSRPIVIVKRQADCQLADNLSPGNNSLGVMLPSTPLQHLLCHDLGFPLVATSANISGEPIITSNTDACARLSNVCDAFLHHDRDIVRPADDPVVYVEQGERRVARTGRGLAPMELVLPFSINRPTLAVGGHLKNTIALAVGERLLVSGHHGDLGSPRSIAMFEHAVQDLQAMFGVTAERLVCDAHPGYASSLWAEQVGLPVTQVYHHDAHASSLAIDYPGHDNWLVFSWDGVGLGRDGTLWGGEALLGSPGQWQRVASFELFRLPGGDKCAREPWRVAAALCWQVGVEPRLSYEGHELLFRAWQRGINSPYSSAAGRLFSAAANLLGLVDEESFEGHGPMLIEALAETATTGPVALPLSKDKQGVLRIDWQPLLIMLLDEQSSVAERARCFHESLAASIAQIVGHFSAQHPGLVIGGSGGVFQNRLLTRLVREHLQQQGGTFLLPTSVAVNDAGLCVGQLIESHYS